MLVSKYLFKYMCEMNPKFNNIVLKSNIIRQKDINEIEKDEEMYKLWTDVINNKKQLTEEAKKKYYIYKNRVKEYNKKYCLEFYHNHTVFPLDFGFWKKKKIQIANLW